MDSFLEYLMTYGWMLLIVAIIGGAVLFTVQDSDTVPDYVDTGERFLEDRVTGYECRNASQNKDGEYTVDCYRSINYNNSTVYNTRSFQITEHNDSAAVKAR